MNRINVHRIAWTTLLLSASGLILAQEIPTPEQIMAENDKDKNGEITKAEAEAAGTPLLGFFDQLDVNKDGKLTLDEIKASFGG